MRRREGLRRWLSRRSLLGAVTLELCIQNLPALAVREWATRCGVEQTVVVGPVVDRVSLPAKTELI